MMNDLSLIRADFPVLNTLVNQHPIIYFDNAATTQKPQVVIDSLVSYYSTYNSNIHRGAHFLANLATERYELTRTKLANRLRVKPEEINFTRGTTESINLIAYAWGNQELQPGDELLITGMEHHANIVPWQALCKRKGALLKVVPVTPTGELDMQAFADLLSSRTRLVAVTWISNALGTINPVKDIVQAAHRVGALVSIDAAQALPHLPIDLSDLSADFLSASAHKMYGPTGIGFLYGKREILERMSPFLYGGEMIDTVTFAETTFNKLPYKFEAGTPNIADTIAWAAALDYVDQIGYDFIQAQEHKLLTMATKLVQDISGLHIIGQASKKASVLSFTVDQIHPYDLGALLDQQGIAIRTGHHCCQPLMQQFQLEGTARASFAFYNTEEEVERFAKALRRAVDMLR